MSVKVEITSKDIERVNAILSGIPKGAEKAMAAAINRGLSNVKSNAFKEARKVYAVSNKAMRANTSTRVKSASSGSPIGYVWFGGSEIPLYEFNVSPKAANTGQPVRAGQYKGVLTPYANAFISVMKTGHIGIFERTGEQGIQSRLQKHKKSKHTEKIGQIMGASMAAMVYENEGVREEIAEKAQEMVNQRLDHEISRILNGYGG